MQIIVETRCKGEDHK